MTKRKRSIIKVIVLLAVFAVVFLAGRLFYYRHYPFDRIRGNVVLTVDGKKCELTEKDISSRKNIDFTNEASVHPNNDGSAEIAIHGGNYGTYDFSVSAPQLDKKSMKVKCFQPNWWNVMDFELNIDADTRMDTVTYSGWYTSIDEYGNTMKDSIEIEKRLSNEDDNGLFFGSL